MVNIVNISEKRIYI